MTLQKLLSDLDCDSMRAALELQDPAFSLEILNLYDQADEPGRSDMRAFFDSEGPRRVHEAKVRRRTVALGERRHCFLARPASNRATRPRGMPWRTAD